MVIADISRQYDNVNNEQKWSGHYLTKPVDDRFNYQPYEQPVKYNNYYDYEAEERPKNNGMLLIF